MKFTTSVFIAVLFGGLLAHAQDKAAIAAAHKSWSDYSGASDSAQYSALSQINRSNVTQLKIAWTYPTGDSNRYFFNPIAAHGLLYVLAKNNSIVALEPTSGKEVWVHPTDPHSRLLTNRGMNYWESADGADRRLLFAQDNQLQAVDARTGKSITSFGKNGKVDLREGLGRDPQSIVLEQSTTPGRVFENLIILGSATNQEYESAPGDIRAYDTRTGALVWTFHTIPHPGEFGYDTWPKDAWKTIGGANAWGELSVDEKRAIVYVPLGSPKYNFYGANRKGANLFGDSLVALDARTGKRIWHFQMVHHDIWDYDPTTGPKLLTLQHNGKSVDAVAVATKEGFLWVFNRVTGEPLWPIEERPVPKSDMPGEETWPTQPFPTNPPAFARQKFTADDLSPYIPTPEERARIKDQIKSARNEGLFTPPGLRDTVQMPGNNGGANWGSTAADPTNGTIYVGSKDLPAMLKLVPEEELQIPHGSLEVQGLAVYRAKCQLCHHADLRGQPPSVPSLVHVGAKLNQEQVRTMVTHGKGLMPAFNQLSTEDLNRLTAFLFSSAPAEALQSAAASEKNVPAKPAVRYRSGFGFMLTSDGLSPIAPPWTSLTAYDLNKGTIKWKIPLGDVPELAAKGIKNTGTHYPKFGPVVTAGGLIFTGTRDRKVRALDEETGKTLWETEVGAAMEGIPAVFEMNGREYIVFCAAAQAEIDAPGKKAQRAPDVTHRAYVAFALPN
ncbi:MAG TPA: PQQ-binding-like beta-propeller repeat protein [Bryobacteraceae bacterium]